MATQAAMVLLAEDHLQDLHQEEWEGSTEEAVLLPHPWEGEDEAGKSLSWALCHAH